MFSLTCTSADKTLTAARFIKSVVFMAVGGNAGLAAAYSGRKLNIPCTVVVPGTTPPFMVERLREEGATVEICGNVSSYK